MMTTATLVFYHPHRTVVALVVAVVLLVVPQRGGYVQAGGAKTTVSDSSFKVVTVKYSGSAFVGPASLVDANRTRYHIPYTQTGETSLNVVFVAVWAKSTVRVFFPELGFQTQLFVGTEGSTGNSDGLRTSSLCDPYAAAGSCTVAQLDKPLSVVVDAANLVLYVSHQDYCIRKVDLSSGWVSTFAGDCVGGGTIDYSRNRPEARFGQTLRLAFAKKVLYIADGSSYCVRLATPWNGDVGLTLGTCGTKGSSTTTTGNRFTVSLGYLTALSVVHLTPGVVVYTIDEYNSARRTVLFGDETSSQITWFSVPSASLLFAVPLGYEDILVIGSSTSKAQWATTNATTGGSITTGDFSYSAKFRGFFLAANHSFYAVSGGEVFINTPSCCDAVFTNHTNRTGMKTLVPNITSTLSGVLSCTDFNQSALAPASVQVNFPSSPIGAMVEVNQSAASTTSVETTMLFFTMPYRHQVLSISYTTLSGTASWPSLRLYAGSAASVSGYSEGTRLDVLFNNPKGLVYVNSGGILVADSGNRCIRRIDIHRTDEPLFTIAGNCGKLSSRLSPELSSLTMTQSSHYYLYVADGKTILRLESAIRSPGVFPSGQLGSLMDSPAAKYSTPIVALTVTASGSLIAICRDGSLYQDSVWFSSSAFKQGDAFSAFVFSGTLASRGEQQLYVAQGKRVYSIPLDSTNGKPLDKRATEIITMTTNVTMLYLTRNGTLYLGVHGTGKDSLFRQHGHAPMFDAHRNQLPAIGQGGRPLSEGIVFTCYSESQSVLTTQWRNHTPYFAAFCNYETLLPSSPVPNIVNTLIVLNQSQVHKGITLGNADNSTLRFNDLQQRLAAPDSGLQSAPNSRWNRISVIYNGIRVNASSASSNGKHGSLLRLSNNLTASSLNVSLLNSTALNTSHLHSLFELNNVSFTGQKLYPSLTIGPNVSIDERKVIGAGAEWIRPALFSIVNLTAKNLFPLVVTQTNVTSNIRFEGSSSTRRQHAVLLHRSRGPAVSLSLTQVRVNATATSTKETPIGFQNQTVLALIESYSGSDQPQPLTIQTNNSVLQLLADGVANVTGLLASNLSASRTQGSFSLYRVQHANTVSLYGNRSLSLSGCNWTVTSKGENTSMFSSSGVMDTGLSVAVSRSSLGVKYTMGTTGTSTAFLSVFDFGNLTSPSTNIQLTTGSAVNVAILPTVTNSINRKLKMSFLQLSPSMTNLTLSAAGATLKVQQQSSALDSEQHFPLSATLVSLGGTARSASVPTSTVDLSGGNIEVSAGATAEDEVRAFQLTGNNASMNSASLTMGTGASVTLVGGSIARFFEGELASSSTFTMDSAKVKISTTAPKDTTSSTVEGKVAGALLVLRGQSSDTTANIKNTNFTFASASGNYGLFAVAALLHGPASEESNQTKPTSTQRTNNTVILFENVTAHGAAHRLLSVRGTSAWGRATLDHQNWTANRCRSYNGGIVFDLQMELLQNSVLSLNDVELQAAASSSAGRTTLPGREAAGVIHGALNHSTEAMNAMLVYLPSSVRTGAITLAGCALTVGDKLQRQQGRTWWHNVGGLVVEGSTTDTKINVSQTFSFKSLSQTDYVNQAFAVYVELVATAKIGMNNVTLEFSGLTSFIQHLYVVKLGTRILSSTVNLSSLSGAAGAPLAVLGNLTLIKTESGRESLFSIQGSNLTLQGNTVKVFDVVSSSSNVVCRNTQFNVLLRQGNLLAPWVTNRTPMAASNALVAIDYRSYTGSAGVSASDLENTTVYFLDDSGRTTNASYRVLQLAGSTTGSRFGTAGRWPWFVKVSQCSFVSRAQNRSSSFQFVYHEGQLVQNFTVNIRNTSVSGGSFSGALLSTQMKDFAEAQTKLSLSLVNGTFRGADSLLLLGGYLPRLDVSIKNSTVAVSRPGAGGLIVLPAGGRGLPSSTSDPSERVYVAMEDTTITDDDRSSPKPFFVSGSANGWGGPLELNLTAVNVSGFQLLFSVSSNASTAPALMGSCFRWDGEPHSYAAPILGFGGKAYLRTTAQCPGANSTPTVSITRTATTSLSLTRSQAATATPSMTPSREQTKTPEPTTNAPTTTLEPTAVPVTEIPSTASPPTSTDSPPTSAPATESPLPICEPMRLPASPPIRLIPSGVIEDSVRNGTAILLVVNETKPSAATWPWLWNWYAEQLPTVLSTRAGTLILTVAAGGRQSHSPLVPNKDGFERQTPNGTLTLLPPNATDSTYNWTLELEPLPQYSLYEQEELEVWIAGVALPIPLRPTLCADNATESPGEAAKTNASGFAWPQKAVRLVNVRVTPDPYSPTPIQKTRTVVTDSAIVVSAALGSTFAVDAQTLAGLSLLECASPAERASTQSYRMLAPTAVEDSFVGMVLGNVMLVVLVLLVHGLAVVAFRRARQFSTFSACALLSFPGVFFTLSILTFQGTAFASLRLLLDPKDEEDSIGNRIMGKVSILVLIPLALAPSFAIRKYCYATYSRYVWDSDLTLRGRLARFLLPPARWTPRDMKSTMGVLGPFGMRSKKVVLFPLALPMLFAIIGCWRPGGLSGCLAQMCALCVAVFLIFLFVLIWRPFRGTMDNVLAGLSLLGLGGAVAVNAAIAHRGAATPALAFLLDVFTMSQTAVTAARILRAIVVAVLERFYTEGYTFEPVFCWVPSTFCGDHSARSGDAPEDVLDRWRRPPSKELAVPLTSGGEDICFGDGEEREEALLRLERSPDEDSLSSPSRAVAVPPPNEVRTPLLLPPPLDTEDTGRQRGQRFTSFEVDEMPAVEMECLEETMTNASFSKRSRKYSSIEHPTVTALHKTAKQAKLEHEEYLAEPTSPRERPGDSPRPRREEERIRQRRRKERAERERQLGDRSPLADATAILHGLLS